MTATVDLSARLARLRRGDRKMLLCYAGRTSRCGLLDAIGAYGEDLKALVGEETACAAVEIKRQGNGFWGVRWPEGVLEIGFSGRTQRDAYLEGELPWIRERPTGETL
jgi:hypothetical protein